MGWPGTGVSLASNLGLDRGGQSVGQIHQVVVIGQPPIQLGRLESLNFKTRVKKGS